MSLENDQHNNNVDDTPRIRTFQSDIADAIKDQKGSVVKIAVKEQERKYQEGIIHGNQKKKNTIFIILGLIFLIVTAGIFGYYFWNEKQKRLAEVANIPQKKSFINGDHITEISVPDTIVLKDILEKNIVESDIPVGQIEQILLVYTDEKGNKTQVPAEDLFESFGIVPPEGFFYSLVPNTYLLGFYQTTESERFILLKTKVFSNTFSQMLVWEKKMGKDFKSMLGYLLSEDEQVTFKDKIIKNEDVRVGYSGDTEVISYAFFGPKKEFLLIASKQDTIQSLLGRFTTKLLEQ